MSMKNNCISIVIRNLITGIIIIAIAMIFIISIKESGSSKNYLIDEQFSDINSIVIDSVDASIIILQSDVNNVSIKSTIDNKAIGIVKQPFVEVKNNILYYDQGYAIGVNTHSNGSIIIQVPNDKILDYDITTGSGDVEIDVFSANNILINATIGDKIVSTNANNIVIESVSGDIKFIGSGENILIDTIQSDAIIVVNKGTKQINFESISGGTSIYAKDVGGYNMVHESASGTKDDYAEFTQAGLEKLVVNAKTVSGYVEISELLIDNKIVDLMSKYNKEDN